MSVRVYLDKEDVKERLKEIENDSTQDRCDKFSIDVDIDDIDHNDLEDEDWYEDSFSEHLDDDDLNNAREEGYDDGYEDGIEDGKKYVNNTLLILRDMIAVGSSDKNIVEKLKEILRDNGEL